MVRVLQQGNPQPASEQFWALYWYQVWKAKPEGRASGHLAAYVQEACYWVAYKLAARTTSLQSGVSDCFQIAIAALPTVLRNYNPEQGGSFKTYASLVFGNTIRDSLRQQQEANSRTDWGLLRKASQKQLIESLQAAGFSEMTIARYRLVWLGFKAVCVPNQEPATRQLSRPTPAMWQAIAHFYNTQRHQLPDSGSEASTQQLEQWLLSAAKQIRAYLTPTVTSLNQPKTETGGEIQDDLSDGEEASPFARLMAEEEIEERQSQRSQIHHILTTALQNLDAELQTLLKLYYQQSLTQQEIAAQLGIKQYTISRRLSSTREKLLLALAKWSQETLHISLTPTAINGMSIVLEEWLEAEFRSRNRDSEPSNE